MKRLIESLSGRELTSYLQENAAKVERTTYQVALNPDELAARRESLADNCIQLNQKEDELSIVKQEYKLKTDPLKMSNKCLLTEIKTRQATVDGVLYHIADHEEGMMEVYDAEGMLISSRRLRPEEKQANIFHLGNTANQ